MGRIPDDYIEKVHAGWYGKIIGIRHGSNIEGWDYDRIRDTYGEITGYLFDFKNFAADDDSNGPIFFIRALEDYTHTRALTAEQIGLTWLNYAPYEHGFFWWGGYGTSTEHTAYLNIRNGIMAPESGSIQKNGKRVAEQIGGQIFIDTWGLVCPGDPALAAEYAQKAASVSHGGNGVYGGMFIAASIAQAFVESDIGRIIETGLSVIPDDCEYSRVIGEVIAFHAQHPDDWRECFGYIRENFGYDKYPGVCHIIPNAAVIILSLLYGNGSFSDTINICNMCGWDTDCNVANAGTILGVANGIEGIDYEKWVEPINDLLICSSVIGSQNILDIPGCSAYIAGLGYKIAGETPPADWEDILSRKSPRFHFEYPWSTHTFRTDAEVPCDLSHTTEIAHSGRGSLKIRAGSLPVGKELRIFYKTYYRPEDFDDNRYEPSFSPLLYPGQTVQGYIYIPEGIECDVEACLFIYDGNNGKRFYSGKKILKPGKWEPLRYPITRMEGALIEEAGVCLTPCAEDNGKHNKYALTVYLDDFDFSDHADYAIDFSKERMEKWHNGLQTEVSQFSYLKGNWEIEDSSLSGSCSDFGEIYTGDIHWDDYTFEAALMPIMGEHHYINIRIQGAIRSYAVGLAPGGNLLLAKNDNGYTTLQTVAFPWSYNRTYNLCAKVFGNTISVFHEGQELVRYTDTENSYLTGMIGASIRNGSRCKYTRLNVTKP